MALGHSTDEGPKSFLGKTGVLGVAIQVVVAWSCLDLYRVGKPLKSRPKSLLCRFVADGVLVFAWNGSRGEPGLRGTLNELSGIEPALISRSLELHHQ